MKPIEDAVLFIVSTYGEMWPGEISEMLDEANLPHTQTMLRDACWYLVHDRKLDLTPERKLKVPSSPTTELS